MLLSTSCKSCSEPIENSYNVNDRIDFAQKHGEHFLIACTICGADHNYSPDEFTAVNNVKMRIKVFIAAIILSITLGFIAVIYLNDYKFIDRLVTYLIFTAPFVVFGLFIKNDTASIRLFNRIKLKGHTVSSKMSSTSTKVQIAAVEKPDSFQGTTTKMNRNKLPSAKKKIQDN